MEYACLLTGHVFGAEMMHSHFWTEVWLLVHGLSDNPELAVLYFLLCGRQDVMGSDELVVAHYLAVEDCERLCSSPDKQKKGMACGVHVGATFELKMLYRCCWELVDAGSWANSVVWLKPGGAYTAIRDDKVYTIKPDRDEGLWEMQVLPTISTMSFIAVCMSGKAR